MNKGHIKSLLGACKKQTKVHGGFCIRGKAMRNIGILASFCLFVFAALTVRPVVLIQEKAEGAAGDSESTITISSGESADLDLSVTSSTGTFASSSDADMATFTVATTNFTGYTLNIAGSDDNGLLVNSEASTSIAPLASATDATTFATGSADTYNNKWGYQANILNPSTSEYTPLMSGNYLPAPTTTDTALNTTACANGSTNCPNSVDTYAIRLGARIDYSKPAGTYTNTFTLTAVGNPVSYSISYNDTTGDSSVTGSPINPAVTTTGETAIGSTAINATLASGTPTRTGYTFNGWCDGTVTHVASGNSTCSGTTYAAGADYLINRTIDNTDITLYAMWNVESYTQTVQVRYQNADGTYGSYSTYNACTANVAYGASHSCSIAADTTYQAASLDSYTVTGAATKQISVDRNTNTVSLTKGTGIDTVTVTGTGVKTGSGTASATVYYGGAVTIAATLTSGYTWENWTGSTTYTNQSQSINSVTSNLSFTANGKSSETGMQAFTKAMCQSQASSASKEVTDSRDNNKYNVRYINGNCWMVQNLRYVGDSGSTSSSMIMKADTSNINADKNLTIGDLTSGNDYNNARIHVATSNQVPSGASYTATDMGVWYNYAAASAGYVTSNQNSTVESAESVCPKNWRLPTNSEQSGITSYSSQFSPVTGGNYANGSVYSPGYGFWWSSTPYSSDSSDRYFLYYDGSSLGTFYNRRNNGFYVRCIRST